MSDTLFINLNMTANPWRSKLCFFHIWKMLRPGRFPWLLLRMVVWVSHLMVSKQTLHNCSGAAPSLALLQIHGREP